jgi:hypothetical protein
MPWQFRMLVERFVTVSAVQQQTLRHLVAARSVPDLWEGLLSKAGQEASKE